MKRLLFLFVLIGVALPVFAATGTITPSPFQVVLDNSGNPINLACVWIYTAGTSTPVATYTDVGLTVANANPIIVGPSGRYTAFLTLGQSYKFVYESPPCSAVSHGAVLVTADNISATPGSSGSTDTLGTAGEALTAGQAVYLSNGSGGKTQGLWYKADSANAYSSTIVSVGIVPNSIAISGTGTIRLGGQVTSLAALVVGSNYYIGTSGAITATEPANSRIIGQADSTTSLIVGVIPKVIISPLNTVEGRLSLTSGSCVISGDVTAAVSIFFTPCEGGNRIALYDGVNWNLRTFTEITIAIGTITNALPYDIFCYDNSGTPACDAPVAWTNTTTRATALALQDGVLSKTGALTRRYIGTFYTTSTTTTEDSYAKRFLYNYYNRVARPLKSPLETTDNWSYSTATWRQANAAPANQVEFVTGIAENAADFTLVSSASHNTTPYYMFTAIGLDSTTTPATQCLPGIGYGAVGGARMQMTSKLSTVPAVGYHKAVWLEAGDGNITATFYGDDGLPAFIQSGLMGVVTQ